MPHYSSVGSRCLATVYLRSDNHTDNFAFLDIEDEIEKNHLSVATFSKAPATSPDSTASVRLGSRGWADVGVGFVDAELTATAEALPRVPPFRASISVGIPYLRFNIAPELIFAAKQQNVYRGETET